MSHLVLAKVAQHIRIKELCVPDDKVLVALSGGADSVALLRIMLELGYKCEAAHCNFHLRGEESERDEVFVRHLCNTLSVPLHVEHFRTTEEANRLHISIEMAARRLRYEWFEKLRCSCNAAVIAVAHHKDDSVETLLINLMRGTGINGLRGIPPKNGYVIRPLLCLDREEIVQYLSIIGQPYVTDSTNLKDEYVRNKIRLNLLPLMETIIPSARENILNTASHIDEAALLYNQKIDEARRRVMSDGHVDINVLLRETSPDAVLFEILYPLGFRGAQLDDIRRALDSQSGKTFYSKEWQVVKDRDRLLIEPLTDDAPQPPVLQMEEYDYVPSFVLARGKNTACLDVDKLTHPLTLRLWKQGDSFVPLGMRGRKKVSDYLTDCKLSLLQKRRQWVLCCGEDIVWLVGERIDQHFSVTPATRRVLMVSLKE